MESPSTLVPSEKQEISNYVESTDVDVPDYVLDSVESMEEDRYFVEELDDSSLEVVDVLNGKSVVFPNVEIAVETVLDSDKSESARRYRSLELNDIRSQNRYLIYDKEEAEAWIIMEKNSTNELEHL